MPKNAILTGVFVRHAAIALSQRDGAKTVRVDFALGWTDRIRKMMGWVELENGQEDVGLSGELALHATQLNAAGYKFDLGSGILKSFRVVRIEDSKGKAEFHLRAQYTSHDKSVAATVESYAETAARSKGSLAIQYEHADPDEEHSDEDQPNLPGTE